MRNSLRRAFSSFIAALVVGSCVLHPAIAAVAAAPSLGELDLQSAKLQTIYKKVDASLDKAIAKTNAKLTARERWALSQALGTIEDRFEGLDKALSDRDAKAFKGEVATFKTQYSTVIAFLKKAQARDTVQAAAATTATPAPVAVTKPIANTVPLDRDVFSALGAKLDADIPSSYLRGETLHVTGTVTTSDEASLLFLLAPDKKTRFIASLPTDGGKFEYSVPLKDVGTYSLVVAAGKSFETKNLATITVSEPAAEPSGLPAAKTANIADLSFERVNFTDLSGVSLMTFGRTDPNTLYTATLTDALGHTLVRRGMGAIAFFWDDLQDFAIGDAVQVRIAARESVSRGSVDAYTASKVVFDRSMILSPAYAPKNEIGFDVRVKNGHTVEITGTTPADENILSRELYVVKPDGSVESKSFDSNLADSADTEILRQGIPVAYSFDVRDDGVYLIEVNYDTGFAAVNVPVVIGSATLPLGTNIIDRMRDEDYASLDEVQRASLEFLNWLRAQYGLGKLRLSDKLGRLAQIKADDMAANAYVGHVDSQGVFIDGTAERGGIDITKSISENVAGGNVGYGILNSALSLSGGHRSNMLGSEWTTVGVGIARSGDRAFYVQVFGME